MLAARIPSKVVIPTLAAALLLTACGAGGMARAVTTAGEGFDRGECLSEQFRTGEPCDQDQFSVD
ncbi:MAG: hypothetical protein IBJ07_12405 [Rhizobiaceae bacterium]|nr:hypothetical protein [Rhizobiaceae bacterium]